uniref:Uncharacterized protein n=1 Tax=Rhizophora mucronata TaxID=61149 RepID=A0A2P2PGK8_RHIMU
MKVQLLISGIPASLFPLFPTLPTPTHKNKKHWSPSI